MQNRIQKFRQSSIIFEKPGILSEKLKTLTSLEVVLFEVELIINNAPLTYVYPNTKEKCLSPKHLLFGRQLLYSSKKLILLYDM